MPEYKIFNVVANEQIDIHKVTQAEKILTALQAELPAFIAAGSGPFLAAVYDSDGNLIAREANRVVTDGCSHNHAEMNAIRSAEKHFQTYDLSRYHLSLYTTAEPCMMCLGGILWSGIKEVYYGVPSDRVEALTGFDEGFKPDWLNEFRRRHITVYGNIAVPAGEQVLRDYVAGQNRIYQPNRK